MVANISGDSGGHFMVRHADYRAKSNGVLRGVGKVGKFMKQKSPKSTLLTDNRQGLITKLTTPRPVTSAAPHPIGGGGVTKVEVIVGT